MGALGNACKPLCVNACKLSLMQKIGRKQGKRRNDQQAHDTKKRGGLIFQSLRETWSIGDSKDKAQVRKTYGYTVSK